MSGSPPPPARKFPDRCGRPDSPLAYCSCDAVSRVAPPPLRSCSSGMTRLDDCSFERAVKLALKNVLPSCWLEAARSFASRGSSNVPSIAAALSRRVAASSQSIFTPSPAISPLASIRAYSSRKRSDVSTLATRIAVPARSIPVASRSSEASSWPCFQPSCSGPASVSTELPASTIRPASSTPFACAEAKSVGIVALVSKLALRRAKPCSWQSAPASRNGPEKPMACVWVVSLP